MPAFSNPITPEELAQAYANGMPRKEDMQDGVMYRGDCRNSDRAVWSAKLGCFLYLRSKFGSTFWEEINHPADDDGMDLFIPETKMDSPVPEEFGEQVESFFAARKARENNG